MTTSHQRKKRRKEAKERARQSALNVLPEFHPIPEAELIKEFREYRSSMDFKSLIREIKDSMYHNPGYVIRQKSYDRFPKKSIAQLQKEYIERLKKKNSNTCLKSVNP
jgi:hypothetical protein